MILTKPYFWAFFVLVILVYSFLPKKEDETFIFHRLFPSKMHYAVIMGASLITLFLLNLDHQLLCQPVPWVIGLLAGLFLWWILFPFLPQNAAVRFLTFICSGAMLLLSIYVLIFFEHYFLIWSGLNLLLIVPLFLLVTNLNKNSLHPRFGFINFYGFCLLMPFLLPVLSLYQLYNEKGKWPKIGVVLIPLLFLIAGFFATQRLADIQEQLDQQTLTKESLSTRPIDAYLLELELGAHWKYHTRFCEYDGWRPPFHDPILVFSKAIGSIEYGYDLAARKAEYSWYFPQRPTEFNCKCGASDQLF